MSGTLRLTRKFCNFPFLLSLLLSVVLSFSVTPINAETPKKSSSDITKGIVNFVNSCQYPVSFMAAGVSIIPTKPLKAGDSLPIAIGDFNQGTANAIHFAYAQPDKTCPDCNNWTDIQKSGQREGYMWDKDNVKYAAACQPTNTAVKQCGPGGLGVCCGTSMNYDGSFGTLWEITPAVSVSGKSYDFHDLSTNYGSGPNSPPTLCGKNSGNNCVTKDANIFFNIPIEVTTNSDCSCGSLGQRKTISCLEASCTDAYQYPEDNKQCSCSSGGKRGYRVELCPSS